MPPLPQRLRLPWARQPTRDSPKDRGNPTYRALSGEDSNNGFIAKSHAHAPLSFPPFAPINTVTGTTSTMSSCFHVNCHQTLLTSPEAASARQQTRNVTIRRRGVTPGAQLSLSGDLPIMKYESRGPDVDTAITRREEATPRGTRPGRCGSGRMGRLMPPAHQSLRSICWLRSGTRRPARAVWDLGVPALLAESVGRGERVAGDSDPRRPRQRRIRRADPRA
jgi:hypothetical protein